MKRLFTVLGAAAAAVALLCACSKQEDSVKSGSVQINIVAGLDEGTKTILGTDGSVTWATSAEKLEVLQVSKTSTEATAKVSSEGITSDEGQTMTFGVSFTSSEDAPFAYYALYPSSAYVTNDNKDVEKLKVELASGQKPTETSFGAGADLLIAKPVTGLSTQPSTLDFQFARIVAVGKMKIADLNSTENVKSVTFKATGKTLAGRSYFNLSTGLVEEYGYLGNGVDNVILDYSAQTIAANGMTAYFTIWPCTFAKDDTFTVVVETQTKKFTKEVTIPSDEALAFKEGRASAFTVSFSGIEGEDVATDLDAAYLTYDEIKDNTGWGAYTTVYSYVQSSGATWTIACYKQAYMQLGNGDGYLKLPDFTKNITSVTVTLSEAPKSGNSLLLATSKSATKGDIASLTGDGSKTEFTFDLTEKEVKTAYLRASGAAAKILSVLVIAGEDTRTALSTPEVIAALVTDSANSIEVVWDEVENAGSYVVTATPAEGNAVSKTVTETSCTFTDLLYETTYSISVVAKPSDYAQYKDSAAGTAEDVTTGEASGSTSTETYTFGSFASSATVELKASNFTITLAKNKGSSNPAWNSNAAEARIYAKGSLTVSSEKQIVAIEYTYTVNANKSGNTPTIDSVEGSTNAGTWDSTNKKWSDDNGDTSVTFSTSGSAGNIGFTSIKVTYKN